MKYIRTIHALLTVLLPILSICISIEAPISVIPGGQLTITFPHSTINNSSSAIKILNQGRSDVFYLALQNVSSETGFLKNVGFKQWTSLTKLAIQYGQIKAFPDTEFEELGQLKELNLIQIGLENITADLFTPLSNLEILNMSYNEITSLPNGIFERMPELQYLDFSFNKLRKISKNIFEPLTLLTKILLINNSIEFLDDDPFSSENKNYTTTLDLSFNNISNINENTFPKQKALRYLGMSSALNAKIECLPSNLFSNMDSLIEVNISRNHLKYLPHDIFHNLTMLQYLDLSNNKISSLNSTLLVNNKLLNTLNLENNQLRNLSNSFFQNLTKLETLNLANNYLSKLDSQIFNRLFSLRIFIIENNKLNLIGKNDSSVLSFSPQIRIIRAYNNAISDVYQDWYALQKFELLDLRSNPIAELKANLTFKSKHLTVLLRVSDNVPLQLRYTPHGYLNANAADLLVLDKNKYCGLNCSCFIGIIYEIDTIYINCTRFDVSELDTDIPFHIRKLASSMKVEFNFTNCSLLSVSPIISYLDQMINVTKLDLSFNKLSNLNDFSKSNFASLKELRLDNNEFTALDWSTLKFLKRTNLTLITLNHNPWRCECATKNLSEYMKTHEKIIGTVSLKCDNEKGTAVSDFDFNEACSNTSIAKYWYLAFGCMIIVVVISILSVSYYRYEKEFKIWMYSFPILRRLPCFREDSIDEDKEYDIFISYARDDEWFVKNKLLPKLEDGEAPFKVCYHLRNWDVGDFIVDQIYKSVEDSRRIIFVLTPNFVQSHWCLMEFNAAFTQSVKEKNYSRILAILLEDIDDGMESSKALKSYINTHSYIKWNADDEKWFWDQLNYKLPHKHIIRTKKRREHIIITLKTAKTG